ncbi:MAG: hypothetical protein EZS28_036809 [Streblomastix strix]|uniref:Uncharacterized protein n=1 Tax=Streblomastix strix TaxID=222440 RepID=A0A5J4UDJ6_9EUKA|nr:MAG: hypothetical protein EZS28_036809 [Streblomastix strix]
MGDYQTCQEQPQQEGLLRINNHYGTKRTHKEQIRDSSLQDTPKITNIDKLTIIKRSLSFLSTEKLHIKILRSKIQRGASQMIRRGSTKCQFFQSETCQI